MTQNTSITQAYVVHHLHNNVYVHFSLQVHIFFSALVLHIKQILLVQLSAIKINAR